MSLQKSAEQLDQLTGIRILAAVWVVLFHLDYQFKHLFGETFQSFGLFSPVIMRGYLGVDLFFILSGFIISFVYQKKMQIFSIYESSKFLYLRLARMYPLHLFMLFVYAAMAFVLQFVLHAGSEHPERFSLLYFVYNFLCIHAWGLVPFTTWNTPSWSISCEWFAYLLFPLTNLCYRRLNGRWSNSLLILTCVIALVLFKIITGKDSVQWTVDYGLVRIFIEFTMGCAFYNIYNLNRQATKTFDIFTLINLVALIIMAFFNVNDAFMVGALGTLLYSLSRSEGLLAKSLSTRFMIYLGEISYSVYMVHACFLFLAFFVLKKLHILTLSPLALASLVVALLAILLGVSACTFRFIEKPARDYLRDKMQNFIPKKRKESSTAPESFPGVILPASD